MGATAMKILFVCEGNINRSQMAAAMFRALVPDATVATAGVYAGNAGKVLSDVSSEQIEAMKEIGFDISGYPITQLTPEMLDAYDSVVLMGPVPGGPIPAYLLDSPKLIMWAVPDPGYGQISVRGARDMIVTLVNELAASHTV